jgi:hypothetical protein
MDRVDFWQLGRSVQERFVESANGGSTPAPLAVRPLSRDKGVLAWSALGACSLVAAIFALRLGFADLGNRFALTPPWFAAVYGGFFALSAFGFLKAAARHVSAYAVPYRPALYLFPIGVIDARATHFTVHRVSEQTQVMVDGARRCLRIELDNGNFEFPTADLALAERAAETISALRDRLANAGPDSSAREQSLVDPLVDNGFKNPFSPTESMRKAVPSWIKAWPLLALVLGLLLGGISWRVRNTLSEARLYAAARASDAATSYREYLARGGHNPDVEAVLLPRAELRDAQAQGSIGAIEQFAATHPNSKIQSEIEAALHQALLKQLASTEAVGTLTALQDFDAHFARYPFLRPDIDRAINARIEATLQKLKPALAPNQARLLPFFDRLLRFTTQHGAEVTVRFQRKPSESLKMAEKALKMSAYFTGDKSLPGQYFDAAHAEPREATAASTLAAAISEHFPNDMLVAKTAPTLDDSADTKPKLPTLLIVYRTEMSGAFTSKKPRFAVSGIGIFCKVSFEIPGDSEPQTFKFSVWRAPDLKSVTDTTTPAELYEAMAAEAFKRFDKKYLATLFVEH